MPTVEIYGASDDLIELEGDINEEFNAYDCLRFLHFSDGTIIKCVFGQDSDKGWQFKAVHEGTATVEVLPAKYYSDGSHDTDRLRLVGDVDSVEFWSSVDGPSNDDIREFFEEFDPEDYTIKQLTAARQILKSN